MKRQNDTLMLWLDKVFQKIAGLDDYPVQSTISGFFKRFPVDTAMEESPSMARFVLISRKEREALKL
jgi:hypothetical protein